MAESLEQCSRIGETMRDRCAELGIGYIFKASFDKANRTSIHSKRGPGLRQGLEWLAEVGRRLGVPVTTDVHQPDQCAPAAKHVDLLQIPAFLCRQTDLLIAAAETGRAVNVKKGQFLSPREMSSVVQKLIESAADHPGILLTERGTFFGYHQLVNDFIGLGDLMDLGWPVCFDVTHSTQLPGGSAHGETCVTGGRPDRAPLLARAAVAAGVQAVFIETHTNPAEALSDGATMLPLEQTLSLLGDLVAIRGCVVSAIGASSV